jgi:hypothetical protein
MRPGRTSLLRSVGLQPPQGSGARRWQAQRRGARVRQRGSVCPDRHIGRVATAHEIGFLGSVDDQDADAELIAILQALIAWDRLEFLG